MRAYRSDLEAKNLGSMRRRFVGLLARESTVPLPCIPSWLGIQIKIMSCAREGADEIIDLKNVFRELNRT